MFKSLVKGEKFYDLKLESFSKENNISKAQSLLAWALSQNMIVLPRSSNPNHIKENFLSQKVVLTREQIDHFSVYDEGYTTHPQYKYST